MIFKNSILVPKRFIGITIFPFIFLKHDIEYHGFVRYARLVNHEKIHLQQQKEMLIVFFYIIYLINFLINLTRHRSYKSAYKNIVFEKEANANEAKICYLKKRKVFAWIKYLKNE